MNHLLEMQMPVLNLVALAPVMIVLTGALIGVLIEAFVPQRHRHPAQVSFTLLTLLAGLVWAVIGYSKKRFMLAGGGSVSVDGPATIAWIMLLFFGLGALLLVAERGIYHGATAFTPMAYSTPGSAEEAEAERRGLEHTEIYPLMLFSLGGMMLFAGATDFIMLFVALEVMSLPLYLMTALARRRRLLSLEASIKYFLLGSVSSAIMLFGIALLYGYSGSFRYLEITKAILGGSTAQPGQGYSLVLAGLALVAVGLLFKIGAVPFHMWTPDVYQGAPTPVTAFMAICVKLAAVVAMLRVFYVALGNARWDWQPVIAVVAVLTIVVGSILAVTQTNMKRMLAYSSVSHAGFILVALCGVAMGERGSSVSSIMMYLAAYGLATVGAFAIVLCVRKDGAEAGSIDDWSGMGRKNPFFGVAMALFLMSFAGLPLTAGFIGKVSVFLAAWKGGYWWLVLVAVIMSVVAAYFYMRVIIVMFGREPAEGVDVVTPGVHAWIPIIVGFVGTLACGLWPAPLLDLVNKASVFLF